MFDFFVLQSTYRLFFLLTLKALFMTGAILYLGIGLGPDEAQYWTWSQSLDWGYYSKPPGIAWQIWLGTQLFGQTEWGVRSLCVLFSFFQSVVVYRLALYAGLLPRTSFWCGLLMAFCPLGIMGSFLAITDVGFLLCWTVACLVIVSALHDQKEPNLLFVGFWIMLGALFKWPIYLFWIFVIFCQYWFYPQQRKLSFSMGSYYLQLVYFQAFGGIGLMMERHFAMFLLLFREEADIEQRAILESF